MPASVDSSPALPDIVRAPRTDAVYNCHAYLTKVPVAAIIPFIEALSRPGEVVVDPFAGSGMTGIATALTGRRARLSDLSVLGRHISRGYFAEVDAGAFRQAADEVVVRARAALGDAYQTVRVEDGCPVEMVRTIWSFTYLCPACSTESVYYEQLRGTPGEGPVLCPSCRATFQRRRWSRGRDVPVRVVVRSTAGKLTEQEVQAVDLAAVARAADDARGAEVPSLTIDEHREMFRRSALAKHGLRSTRSFFSSRNALALYELHRAIGGVADEALRQKLAFAFTAILTRASRRYQWGPKRPLNAQNQTYYIAPVHYEWNVFELYLRKVEAAIRSDAQLGQARGGDVTYDLASADELAHLDAGSVDYLFTDPPFGSNIFYSDMSLFHEAWLESRTDADREAVVHRAGKNRREAMERYEGLLRGAFSEAARVLAPGRYMSVVFGNSSGAMWALVLRALRDAGFVDLPVHVAILDKGQRSVKGLSSGSESVVTVDLVVTVRKPSGGTSRRPRERRQASADATELLRSGVARLDGERARNPSYLYAAVLREAIRQGLLVDELHLSDLLVALRRRGHRVDPASGLLEKPLTL